MTTPVSFRRFRKYATAIVLGLLTFGPACQRAMAAEAVKIVFNLPSDIAERSLKRFSVQSGREVIFDSDAVGNVTTNAVEGDYTPREALDRMLDGKRFIVTEDEKTGAFTVRREAAPASARGQDDAVSARPTERKASDDAVMKLSPFQVTSEHDTGYLAANTLAGSRLNGSLADTPASIQVMTKDFLDDIGAVNVSQAMEYALAGGNDIGTGNVGGTTGNGLIENDFNFEIRGYHDVEMTRDFFPTVLDGDAFNLERIDISRGPNSILFGVGGAGGIVNFTAKRALVSQDVNEALLRVASWDSFREAIDLNRRLLNDRVAVRVNAMNQKAKGYQDFVTDDQKRAALAVTIRPTDSTTVYVDSEIGQLHQNRARPWLPFDEVSQWKDDGKWFFPFGTPQYPADGADLSLGNYTQWPQDGASAANPWRSGGLYTSTTPAFTDGPLKGDVLWDGTSGSGGRYYRTSMGYPANGFNSSLNMPDGSVPRTLNISGPGSFVDKKYDTLGVTLDQKLANDLYAEAVVNHADMHEHNQIPIPFAQIALLEDVTTTLPSFLGDRSYDATGPQPGQGAGALNFTNALPNPYVGQYMAVYHPGYNNYRFINEDERLQLTYHLDLGKWAGKHDLLAFVSRSEATREEQGFNEENVSPNRPGGPDSRYDTSINFSGRVSHIDPFSNSTSERGVPDPWTAPLPSGPMYGNPAWSFADGWINSDWTYTRSTILTEAVAMQSKFLNDTLVTTIGIRHDKLDINNFDGNVNYQDDLGVVLAPTPGVGIVDQATTHTLGAVYTLPVLKGVSVFANKSTNFQDQPGQVLFGDQGHQTPIGPIRGDGDDFGLKFDFLGGRINATLTWFKVNESNLASGFDGNIPTYISAIWRTIANGGPDENVTETHEANGADTSSQVSKGAELEITANPTRDWRLSFNISKVTNVVSGLDTHLLAYENANLAAWQASSALAIDNTAAPGNIGNNTVGALITGLNQLIAVDKQDEGQVETNQRKWNANLFTAYEMSAGPLKGLVVGGGLNYRGAEVLGRDPETHQLFTGSIYYTANALVGYQFKVKRSTVKIQLNVQNLFNYSHQQVLASTWNPTTSTLNEFYYYILPRNYSLTTTFDF